MLRNARYESETSPAGPWRTFNGWKHLDAETSTLDAFRLKPGPRNDKRFGQRIDYLYVSQRVRVLDYATVPDMRKGGSLYPSDHFPIVATIEI